MESARTSRHTRRSRGRPPRSATARWTSPERWPAPTTSRTRPATRGARTGPRRRRGPGTTGRIPRVGRSSGQLPRAEHGDAAPAPSTCASPRPSANRRRRRSRRRWHQRRPR
eukprot:5021800-Alexandrium_andersonii.AAC.1